MSAAALSAVIVSDDEGGGCFGKRQSGADLDSGVKGSNNASPRASFSEKEEEPTLSIITLAELGPRESWKKAGEGGFGIAYHTVFAGKGVIVKCLSAAGLEEETRSAAASPTKTGLFAGEIKNTAYIQGTEGVVKAYGAGFDEKGNAFLVLERIDFVLGDYLAKPGDPLPRWMDSLRFNRICIENNIAGAGRCFCFNDMDVSLRLGCGCGRSLLALHLAYTYNAHIVPTQAPNLTQPG